jgi:signal transduction histidine kinase
MSEASKSANAILAAEDAAGVDAAHAAAVAELGPDDALDEIRRFALERIELRARLATANRAREVLLASIAHDLRNPLNTFAMSAGLLRDDVEHGMRDRTRDLALIQRMERAIDRMQHLIDDLGEASRFESRRVELVRRGEPIARLVADAVAGARALADEHSVTLIAEPITGAATTTSVDHARIVQAFAKLVSYCVRVIGDGGSITVATGQANGSVVITLTAVTAGKTPLPPLEEGRASLALLLTRAIIDLHGGTLTLDHAATLTIRITLPT